MRKTKQEYPYLNVLWILAIIARLRIGEKFSGKVMAATALCGMVGVVALAYGVGFI